MQVVVSSAPQYRVVADHTQQSVGTVVAHQNVVARSTGEVFNRPELLAAAIGHRAPLGQQVRIHSDADARIHHGVCASAAFECVVSLAENQRVVTAFALQPVVTIVALQVVGISRTGQVFDALVGIARRITQRAARGQAGFDGGGGVFIRDGVGAIHTIEAVGPAHIGIGLVSGFGQKAVIVGRAHGVFNAVVHANVHIDQARGAVAEVGPIAAFAALQAVGAPAPHDRVVSRATNQGVVGQTAPQNVIACAPAQGQARGVGAAIERVVASRAQHGFHAGKLTARQFKANAALRIGLCRQVNRVHALTADEAVMGQVQPFEHVIARATAQSADRGMSSDHGVIFARAF